MANTIYLPASEETDVVINIGNKEKVILDIFELEEMFITSQAKATEMGTDWQQEFPSVFADSTAKKISAGQAVLLWTGVKQQIELLKKRLHEESDSSKKPVSRSKRKTKKKSG